MAGQARRHGKRVLPGVLGIGVVVFVFAFALPRIASYRDVWEVLSDLSWPEVAALAAATLLNVATFAPPWMAALPGLGFPRALVLTQASTATASVLPGGEAFGIGLSVAMLRAWGFTRGAIAAAAAVVTGLNVMTKVFLPTIAVAALLVTGRDGGPLTLLTTIGVLAAGGIVVAIAIALRSDGATRQLGALGDRVLRWVKARFRREHTGSFSESLVRFRRESIALLRSRGHWLVLATLAGHLSVFVVLLVSLRAVGVDADEVSTVDVFAAWSLTRLLTAVPITPGGLGIIELGLTGWLVAAGGANADVVAAVLLYRLLTWLPPILLGIPSALVWRRLHPGSTAAASPQPPVPDTG